MATVEHSITIRRPVEEVYTWLLDPGHAPTHLGQVVELRPLSGDHPKVGAQFEEVVDVLGRRVRLRWEYAAVDANRGLAVRSVGGPFPLEVWVRTLPSPAGTEVTVRHTVAAEGTEFAPPDVAQLASEQQERELASLKQLLEQAA